MQITTDNAYVLIALGMCGTFLLVSGFILFSVRNQNKLLKQRQRLQTLQLDHQKELLGAVIASQEAERKRIGQDLHDDVGTTLSSLRLLIEMFRPAGGEDEHYAAFMRTSKETIDKVVRDVRNISHNLSPATLGYYGLASAVSEHAEMINRSGKLQIDIINHAEDILTTLDMPTATAFYRVVEELLNNTIKHSGASQATITFNSEAGDLTVTYHDNGKGLNIADGKIKKGMGLQNIESRLQNVRASYKISSDPGKGFHIHIQYPGS